MPATVRDDSIGIGEPTSQVRFVQAPAAGAGWPYRRGVAAPVKVIHGGLGA